MKLAVIGATGGIGTAVTQQALAAGHEVVALVREPDRMKVSGDRLTVERVDVVDPERLALALKGTDAVVSALGPRRGEHPAPPGVVSGGAAALIPAMARAGVSRLVIVSADGAFVQHNDGFLTRVLLKPLVGRLFGAGFADLRRMEARLRGSELDWTIIRPPRLTDAPYTGRYRMAVDGAVGRGYRIARADVAHAILHAVQTPDLIGHVVNVAH